MGILGQFGRLWTIYTVFPVISDHFHPLSAHLKKRVTDGPSNRDAWTHLKTKYILMADSILISMDNVRLFRLISKLNTILERDEMNLDTNWSETDDRYILKLFRDFVFHQV